MRDFENIKKKIVYWGVGTICNYCLEQYPEIHPHFLIDTYVKKTNFGDKLIKRPEDIKDWAQYYIIITIKSDQIKMGIQNYLGEKGLRYGEDFCGYNEFFMCAQPSIETSINLVTKYMTEHLDAKNSTMFVIPVVDIRHNKNFIKFLSSYMEKRGHNKNIVFSNLKVVSSELASKRLNCKVFYTPNINKFENVKRIRVNFSEETYNWLKKLEFRKLADGSRNNINESLKILYYYKTIIELIKPSKIIIWGNWGKESYILGYLAECCGIPHGYMEYGWIPGTYQVDPRGIAGQSEYAVNPHLFDNIEIKSVYDIEQVKQYIREHKLDSGIFDETKEDREMLLKIRPEKKSVFFVGLGERGLQINPKSDYWKKYVSNVVESTEEVLTLLVKLSRKNNWNLIFKPHPGDPVPKPKCGLEDVIIVREMEIDWLICLADVVVSIASAVDYKVLIYGKPLVQLGITGLLGKGCTYTVSKKEMLEEQIILALKNGMTKEQTQNYNRLLQILLQKYLWDDMSERGVRYGLSVERDFLE